MSSDHRDGSTIRFFFNLIGQTLLYCWLYWNMEGKDDNKYLFIRPKHIQCKFKLLMLIALTVNRFLFVVLFIWYKLDQYNYIRAIVKGKLKKVSKQKTNKKCTRFYFSRYPTVAWRKLNHFNSRSIYIQINLNLL